MDDHTRGEELGLQTEGAMLTEAEIKELSRNDAPLDFPEPGEIADPEKEKTHSHAMPEGEVHIIDEQGKEII